MAIPSRALITALRKTAARLRSGSRYQWGHMGSCNCGHLAQTLTGRTHDQIHRYALERCGDWNQQLRQYCPDSGMSIDRVISEMLEWGLSSADLGHLERLDDPKILNRLPADQILHRNRRGDAALYLEAWAELLADKLSDRKEIVAA